MVVNGNDEDNLSYDTKKINKFMDIVTYEIQKEMLNLENGNIKNFEMSSRYRSNNYKKIKNGILMEVSLTSIRGSTLFANIGPTIPIKLSFIGSIYPNLDVKIKEYGINNVIIETSILVSIEEQVSMPISSKKQTIDIKQPLSIDIVRGKIPDYYSGLLR